MWGIWVKRLLCVALLASLSMTGCFGGKSHGGDDSSQPPNQGPLSGIKRALVVALASANSPSIPANKAADIVNLQNPSVIAAGIPAELHTVQVTIPMPLPAVGTQVNCDWYTQAFQNFLAYWMAIAGANGGDLWKQLISESLIYFVADETPKGADFQPMEGGCETAVKNSSPQLFGGVRAALVWTVSYQNLKDHGIFGGGNGLSTPTNFTATSSTNDSIDLSWDFVSAAIGYKLYSSLDGVSFALLATKAANVKTHHHGGLASGTTVHYKLTAYNASGESAPAVASATVGSGGDPCAINPNSQACLKKKCEDAGGAWVNGRCRRGPIFRVICQGGKCWIQVIF